MAQDFTDIDSEELDGLIQRVHEAKERSSISIIEGLKNLQGWEEQPKLCVSG
ncbi:hypothetical protein MRO13_12855 [Vibrio metschnikovii]|uniref:hypothetical protein n=1 Tax=Vibrio metschnikovii TaxID=28172 RepID=UPI00332DFAF8